MIVSSEMLQVMLLLLASMAVPTNHHLMEVANNNKDMVASSSRDMVASNRDMEASNRGMVASNHLSLLLAMAANSQEMVLKVMAMESLQRRVMVAYQLLVDQRP